MVHDPLTDIVGALDLTGGVFVNAELTEPWAITSHVTEEDCRPFMPIPRQVIAYHVVVEGEAIVSLDDDRSYQPHHHAKAGDVIFLPSNAHHVLASGVGGELVSAGDLLLPEGQDGLVRIEHGGGGAMTRILCGFMASQAGSTPLLETIPELLVINIESLETRRWIEASVAMAAREFSSGRCSSSAIVSDLCRLLLTEALRTYIEAGAAPLGWLAGMAHPRMSRALARIHTDLADVPSVEQLAAEVGMSRSAFVDRFTEVMAVGPRRYIVEQRMKAATALLQETDLTTAEVAYRVGYDAPEAFSRAYKRETGQTPTAWREAGKKQNAPTQDGDGGTADAWEPTIGIAS